jgi:hypothetical protein
MASSASSSIRRSARRGLVRAGQIAARKLNATGLEQVYQANYFELARSTEWLSDPPLASARGGTANYSMLYLLLNALRDPAVTRVIEFGVGASSRLISDWSLATEHSSVHVESDPEWLSRAVDEAPNRTLIDAPLKPRRVADREITWYDASRPEGRFQVVSVDGPPAWSKSRRFDRLGVLDWIPELLDDEFVIIVDDASRSGESKLASSIVDGLRRVGIEAGSAMYSGADSQMVIASPAFSHLLYL